MTTHIDENIGMARIRARGFVTGSVPSPAPSPEPQDVREALLAVDRHPGITIRCADDEAAKVWNHLCGTVKAALAQSGDAQPREPDDTKVICPNCTHQFTAISVADQARLRAQSDAQPVGWQYRWKRSAQTWSEWCIEWNKDVAASYSRHPEYEVRPLYTAPHRPDASGLIAAAEIFEQASDMAAMKAADLEIHGTQQFGINALSNLASELKDEAEALRSRAADRSAK